MHFRKFRGRDKLGLRGLIMNMSRQQVFKAVRQELVYRLYRGISRKRRIKKFQFNLKFFYFPQKSFGQFPWVPGTAEILGLGLAGQTSVVG